MYLGALGRLGDVISDATTWITYGNDILSRATSDSEIGAEALKAAQNINTFLGNRGEELQASSPETVTALGEMTDKLAKLAKGKIKYDSVSGAFFDEFGNAVKGEVTVGARAVAAAPGQAYEFVKTELDKALEKGKEAAKDLAMPIMVIAAGAVAVAYIIYGKK